MSIFDTNDKGNYESYPRVKGKKERQKVELNRHLYPGKHSQVVAHDYISGEDLLIKSAPCGLACYCDAIIIKVINNYS
jgi:hypothetical protein